ncbi:MAG: SBBP repeat-containing protein [Bacteroidota bacterium]
MKKLYLIKVYIFLSIYFCASVVLLKGQGPSFNWVKKYGNNTYYDNGRSVALDPSGNVLATGYMNDTFYIAKLNSSGNTIWYHELMGLPTAIESDASGNIYVAGGFKSTVDFDPGVNKVELTSIGDMDNFVLKLDASGNLLWVKSFGSTYYDRTTNMTLDKWGNILLTGNFANTVDFDPGSGTANKTEVGSYDIFILKLNNNGDFSWVEAFGDSYYDESFSITADNNGNVFLASAVFGTVDFNPGSGIDTKTSAGNYDIFITKLDSSGVYVKTLQIGSTGVDNISSITCDGSDNLFACGTFSNTVDFDPGSGTANLTATGISNFYILKLNTAGQYVWAKSMGNGNGAGGLMSLTLDNKSGVYVIGNFSDTVDFNPGAGVNKLYVSKGIYYKKDSLDICIFKLDSSGNYQWARGIGGSGYDAGYDIAVDNSGNVYTTGAFWSTVDFDPNSGIYNVTSSGKYDAFIHKMSGGLTDIKSKSAPQQSFIIYPNPNDGLFAVDHQSTNPYTIEIYNTLGMLLYSNTATGKTMIDIQNYSTGMYIVKLVEAGQQMQSYILLKQ